MGSVSRVGRATIAKRGAQAAQPTQPITPSESPAVSYARKKKYYQDKGWITESQGEYKPESVRETPTGYIIEKKGTYTSFRAKRSEHTSVYVKERIVTDKEGRIVKRELYSLGKEGGKQKPRLDKSIDYTTGEYKSPRLERVREAYKTTEEEKAVLRLERTIEPPPTPTGRARLEARARMSERAAEERAFESFLAVHGGKERAVSVDPMVSMRRDKGYEARFTRATTAIESPSTIKEERVLAGSMSFDPLITPPELREQPTPQVKIDLKPTEFKRPAPYSREYLEAHPVPKDRLSVLRRGGERLMAEFEKPQYDLVFMPRLKQEDYSRIRSAFSKGAEQLDIQYAKLPKTAARTATKKDLLTRSVREYTPGRQQLGTQKTVEFVLPKNVYQLGAELAAGEVIGVGGRIVKPVGRKVVKFLRKSPDEIIPKVSIKIVKAPKPKDLITFEIPRMNKAGVIRGAKRTRQIRARKAYRRKVSRQQYYDPRISYDPQSQEALVRLRTKGLKKAFVKERQVRMKLSGEQRVVDKGLRTDIPALRGVGTPSGKAEPVYIKLPPYKAVRKSTVQFPKTKYKLKLVGKKAFIEPRRVTKVQKVVGVEYAKDISIKTPLLYSPKTGKVRFGRKPAHPLGRKPKTRRARKPPKSQIVIADSGRGSLVLVQNVENKPFLLSVKRAPKKRIENLFFNRPAKVNLEQAITTEGKVVSLTPSQEAVPKVTGGFRKGQKAKLFKKVRAKQRAYRQQELPSYSTDPTTQLEPASFGQNRFESIGASLTKKKRVKLWWEYESDYVEMPGWDWSKKTRSIVSDVKPRFREATRLSSKLQTSLRQSELQKSALSTEMKMRLSQSTKLSSVLLYSQATALKHSSRLASAQLLAHDTSSRLAHKHAQQFKLAQAQKLDSLTKMSRPKTQTRPKRPKRTRTKQKRPAKIEDKYVRRPGKTRFKFPKPPRYKPPRDPPTKQRWPKQYDEEQKGRKLRLKGFERLYKYARLRL